MECYNSVHLTRAQTSSRVDFGGIGDGKGSNTKAFRAAVEKLGKAPGGGQLVIPPVKYLTGPFNLSSHFTLYLQKDVVILASPDEGEWTVVDALPSYGKGKEPPFGRFNGFISGSNLTDVVIITEDTGYIFGIDSTGHCFGDLFCIYSLQMKELEEYVSLLSKISEGKIYYSV